MVCPDHHSRKKDRAVAFRTLALNSRCARGKHYPESLFLKRRTSRISFLPTPVGDTAVATLTNLAAQWGQRYQQVTDSAQIEIMLAQNADALFADLNTPAYHDEIVSWFRFTDRQRDAFVMDWIGVA